jgi:hypothetical protein
VYGVVGDRFDTMPIPLKPEATHFFEAGVLTIGVELRAVDPVTVREELGELSAEQWSAIEAQQPKDLDDSGPSIHVLSEGIEYLRFDCFRVGPHYHYIHPEDGYQVVVTMDRAACGEPLDFAVWCLRHRLIPMLEAAGQPALAAQVDPSAVAAVLPRIERLARAVTDAA